MINPSAIIKVAQKNSARKSSKQLKFYVRKYSLNSKESKKEIQKKYKTYENKVKWQTQI
jgi:hypothetical protein